MSTPTTIRPTFNLRLIAAVESLEVPESAQKQARERYVSFGKHLQRPDSVLRIHHPEVYPQGSFALGTAIRPLREEEEYDLDMTVQMEGLAKTDLTQAELTELLLVEAHSYASMHGFNDPPERKHRCVRLPYGDKDLRFHLDAVQVVPEDEQTQWRLHAEGVPPDFAQRAVAVTDDRSPAYEQITDGWLTSNPGGYARWFKLRMEPIAKRLLEKRMGVTLSSIESVPTWDLKTPLQRSIQLLKRHRNVYFEADPSRAPISMIVTTLAAHAYKQEEDLPDALSGILARMPEYVAAASPRIANPTNPGEDFADRWLADPSLESDLYAWIAQANVDFEGFGRKLDRGGLAALSEKALAVRLPSEREAELADRVAPLVVPSVVSSTTLPPLKPWGVGAR